MAGSPIWKLYDSQGRYQASAKEVEFLAAGIGFYGEGATIRNGHTMVVWTEGNACNRDEPGGDGIAYESYDRVALLAEARVNGRQKSEDEKRAAFTRRQLQSVPA